MENHFDLTDFEFESRFASGGLDSGLFNHEAHLRLAWIHITNYGIDRAIENICFQLQNFIERLGAGDKYNTTLTIAAVRAVYHFTIKSKAVDFKDFIAENPRLKFQFKELIGLHYSTNIFISERAKKEYLEPELLPFD